MTPTDMRDAARDVIGYVHKNDRDAYEFWRAHAIAFARQILAEPPIEQVRADLAAWGVDVAPAVEKVLAAVEAAKEREAASSHLIRLAARLLREKPLGEDDPATEAVMREVAIEIRVVADVISGRGPTA